MISKQTLIEHCSFGLRQIYCPMVEDMPSTDEIAKVTAALLRSVGIRKDTIEITKRKLKAGGYRYFVIVDGVLIVDPTALDSGNGVFENEHPLSDEFKGRGREAKEETEDEETDTGELTALHVIKAITLVPKMPTSKHRDDQQVFYFKTKDLRSQLKKGGVAINYSQLSAFIDEHMSKHLQKLDVHGVQCYQIDTGMSLGDWIQRRLNMADITNAMYQHYIKHGKATG